MGMSWEDVVLIEESKNSGDPTVVTVNCPNKAGLGCDLLRIVLELGLYVTRGDFSTDGKWCYVVLWVVPRPISLKVDWESLKNRLVSCCPSLIPVFYLDQFSGSSTKSSPLYLLKVFSLDRKGLIHDVTKLLCELELTIQRLKVMTTPDGKVLDLFFVTDGMNILHTKIGREETCEHLSVVLGECCISCELQLAGPEYEYQQGFSSIPEVIAEKLFDSEFSAMKDDDGSEGHASKIKEASVVVDNLLSPAHSLLQIQCRDQKGLIYDILRISKDCDIQIAYGRVSPSVNGYRSLDLFIQNKDGKKIVNNESQITLCSRLKEEMLRPLRVMIINRGPDTELLVANPVEISGKGRPRVVYDVTFALKTLGICIFSAEIGRHSTLDREWEVYRFLLVENRGFPLTSKQVKQDIINKVRRTLMGW